MSKQIKKNTATDTKTHKLKIDVSSLTSCDSMENEHGGNWIIIYGNLITGEGFEVAYQIDHQAVLDWGATTLDRSHIHCSPLGVEIESLLEWDDENREEKENDPMFEAFSDELATLLHEHMTELVINGAKKRVGALCVSDWVSRICN